MIVKYITNGENAIREDGDDDEGKLNQPGQRPVHSRLHLVDPDAASLSMFAAMKYQ